VRGMLGGCWGGASGRCAPSPPNLPTPFSPSCAGPMGSGGAGGGQQLQQAAEEQEGKEGGEEGGQPEAEGGSGAADDEQYQSAEEHEEEGGEGEGAQQEEARQVADEAGPSSRAQVGAGGGGGRLGHTRCAALCAAARQWERPGNRRTRCSAQPPRSHHPSRAPSNAAPLAPPDPLPRLAAGPGPGAQGGIRPCPPRWRLLAGGGLVRARPGPLRCGRRLRLPPQGGRRGGGRRKGRASGGAGLLPPSAPCRVRHGPGPLTAAGHGQGGAAQQRRLPGAPGVHSTGLHNEGADWSMRARTSQ
jgi:hypothetical protein